MINSTNITRNIYQERAKILNSIPIFEITPYRTNVTNLNANCNVTHLAEHLFVNFPSLITNKKYHRCNHEHLRKIPVISININIILQNGLSALRNTILDTNHDKASTCKKCHESVLEKYTFQSHLIVDCSVFTDGQYIASIGIEKKSAALGSIPNKLNMGNKNYIIAGAVSYHQYASDRNNGHYTAFVYDTTQWYLYDDMRTKRKIASDDEEVAPHLIVYTMVAT
ncbi:hypothetical protein ALC60_08473 [Trachymyrmex zeteki]|uniref:USP domain-containing protein n=1 Tax=Mycetomoellerius zeteki TaxID=64791 RepID=A0A151WXB3_9HYME|nr:hypothetical protein ALC60_08473 [Trachymyrmex zeteki]